MGMIEPALLLCMILGKRLGARGASASDDSQLSFGTLVKDFLVRRARLLQTCRCKTLLAEARIPIIWTLIKEPAVVEISNQMSRV